MKTFVIGDIHGTHKALVQCLQRANFNYQQDRLIVLGDISDCYPDVPQCFEELLKIRHCDYIIGNHDLWVLDWVLRGIKSDVWLKHGGSMTIDAYKAQGMPTAHVDFLKRASLYLEVEDKFFVHAGFDPEKPIFLQADILPWDRTLIRQAARIQQVNPGYHFGTYKEIYLGHTPTDAFGSTQPLKLCNVFALDTGAGWGGPLTIMDIHTKQFVQSDATAQLYPDVSIRKRT